MAVEQSSKKVRPNINLKSWWPRSHLTRHFGISVGLVVAVLLTIWQQFEIIAASRFSQR
jgi:hypothetical protein